jgi:hypothetical protein
MANRRASESASQRIGASPHLGEEQVHRYLDGEMTDIEYAEMSAHLTACGACRAELAALQRLFLALDELAPAPDLVPAVRAGLTLARPAASWKRWLAPALQAGVVAALLVWAATRPYAYWPHAAETLQRTALSSWGELASWAAGLAVGLPGWVVDLPGTVAAWPGAVSEVVQRWAAQLPTWSWPSLSSSYMVVLVAVLVVAALVGNCVLLRRAALNGQRA